MASAELEHVSKSLKTHYGIDVAEMKLLDEGSTPNHHVKASSGAQFLVKALRSRLGAWVAENASQVTALAAHAASHGLQTPAPVKSLDGALVAVVPGPNADEVTHFVVLDWAVGYERADLKLASQPSLESAVLGQIGGILAKLHLLPLPTTFTLASPEAPGGHVLCDMGRFLESAADPSTLFPGQESEDAKWFRGWLPKLVEFWKTVPEPHVLCHGDPYLDNMLVKDGEHGPELMLLDWEDSTKTNAVVDLAASAVGTCFTLTLDEGSEDVPLSIVKDRIVALIGGYEAQRALSPAERALLRPSMQVCAWACGAFRYGRFLEGVTDVKTRKYGELIEVVKMLDEMGPKFEEMAFAAPTA